MVPDQVPVFNRLHGANAGSETMRALLEHSTQGETVPTTGRCGPGATEQSQGGGNVHSVNGHSSSRPIVETNSSSRGNKQTVECK